jgi:hypothetical protein
MLPQISCACLCSQTGRSPAEKLNEQLRHSYLAWDRTENRGGTGVSPVLATAKMAVPQRTDYAKAKQKTSLPAAIATCWTPSTANVMGEA